MNHEVLNIIKDEPTILKNPVMSLCFFSDSINVLRHIQDITSENTYLIGVKYPKSIGDDIQFAVTGHKKKRYHGKNKLKENSDDAIVRELGEELGIIVDNVNDYKCNTDINDCDCNINVTNCKCIVHTYNENNQKMVKSSSTETNIKVYEVTTQNFNDKITLLYSFNNPKIYEDKLHPYSHKSMHLYSYQYLKYCINNSTKYNNVTNEKPFKKVYTKTIYDVYVIPCKKCIPLSKNVTLQNRFVKIKDEDTTKVTSYIYGSKEELIKLVNNVNFVIKDKDQIEAFVILRLIDIIKWLSTYEKLNYKPKSISDKNLQTNFDVLIYKFKKIQVCN